MVDLLFSLHLRLPLVTQHREVLYFSNTAYTVVKINVLLVQHYSVLVRATILRRVERRSVECAVGGPRSHLTT
jgi:hypothetical protein